MRSKMHAKTDGAGEETGVYTSVGCTSAEETSRT